MDGAAAGGVRARSGPSEQPPATASSFSRVVVLFLFVVYCAESFGFFRLFWARRNSERAVRFGCNLPPVHRRTKRKRNKQTNSSFSSERNQRMVNGDESESIIKLQSHWVVHYQRNSMKRSNPMTVSWESINVVLFQGNSVKPPKKLGTSSMYSVKFEWSESIIKLQSYWVVHYQRNSMKRSNPMTVSWDSINVVLFQGNSVKRPKKLGTLSMHSVKFNETLFMKIWHTRVGHFRNRVKLGKPK